MALIRTDRPGSKFHYYDTDNGLVFVRTDKDGDLDYDPLTAAAWENSTKSGADTINWNSVFGVPTGARAVVVYAFGSDATPGTTFNLKAKSSTTNNSGGMVAQVNAVYVAAQLVVPVAADGTSYYTFSAAWDNFSMRVVGWYL
jgi:hypothetical protein